MKRRNDQYNAGNDYLQQISGYFRTTQEEVDAISGKSPIYSDGLYHYTIAPVYELSGGVSALNKRVFTKLPQDTWQPGEGTEALSGITDASAVFSPDYSTAEYDFETDNNWSETPKGKA